MGWLQGERPCACAQAFWALSDHTKAGSLSVLRQHVRPLRVGPEGKQLERVFFAGSPTGDHLNTFIAFWPSLADVKRKRLRVFLNMSARD